MTIEHIYFRDNYTQLCIYMYIQIQVIPAICEYWLCIEACSVRDSLYLEI